MVIVEYYITKRIKRDKTVTYVTILSIVIVEYYITRRIERDKTLTNYCV